MITAVIGPAVFGGMYTVIAGCRGHPAPARRARRAGPTAGSSAAPASTRCGRLLRERAERCHGIRKTRVRLRKARVYCLLPAMPLAGNVRRLILVAQRLAIQVVSFNLKSADCSAFELGARMGHALAFVRAVVVRPSCLPNQTAGSRRVSYPRMARMARMTRITNGSTFGRPAAKRPARAENAGANTSHRTIGLVFPPSASRSRGVPPRRNAIARAATPVTHGDRHPRNPRIAE